MQRWGTPKGGVRGMPTGNDYLHLVKIEGRWVIVYGLYTEKSIR